MRLIVAVDEKWAIGNKGNLLVRIPADHKNFAHETTGKIVVLGRKTLETFPQGLPLKNRVNVILSTDPNYSVKDAVIVHDLDELKKELEKFDSDDVYIIGGQSVYNELLPWCDTAIVTKIDHIYDADAYFPNLDSDDDWEIAEISEEQYYFDLTYHFVKYVRRRSI